MRALAQSLSDIFGARTSYTDANGRKRITKPGDPLPLSRKAKAAIAKYGAEACRMAYRIHTERGEGAASIALAYPVPNVHTTRQADSAIDAGRELAEGRK